MFLFEPLFESSLFGVTITPAHLALAVAALAMASTYLLVRVTRLNSVVVVILSLLITQLLAGWLLVLLLSHTEQPIRDEHAWWARLYAYWNVAVYWVLCSLVSGPASVLLLAWLKRKPPAPPVQP